MNADAFVSTIAGHSGPGDLINLLSSLKSQVPTITGRIHITLLQNIASSLDPVTHSLGMLFILWEATLNSLTVFTICFSEFNCDWINPHAHFWYFLMRTIYVIVWIWCREAQSRSGINQGDLVFVETTGRFLQLCSAAQIQLAPETSKCHPQYHLWTYRIVFKKLAIKFFFA